MASEAAEFPFPSSFTNGERESATASIYPTEKVYYSTPIATGQGSWKAEKSALYGEKGLQAITCDRLYPTHLMCHVV